MLYHDFSLIFSLLSFLFLDHLGVDTYMITPYLNLSICVFHQDVDTFLDNLSTVISLRKLTLVKYLASHYRCNTRQCSLSQYLQFSCSTHFHPGFILHIVVAYYSLPSFELLLVLATFFSTSLSVLENKAQFYLCFEFVLHLHGSVQLPATSGALP